MVFALLAFLLFGIVFAAARILVLGLVPAGPRARFAAAFLLWFNRLGNLMILGLAGWILYLAFS